LLLLGTAEGFRPVSTLLYAMGGRRETPIPPPRMTREKSQFRAQHHSLPRERWGAKIGRPKEWAAQGSEVVDKGWCCH
jgi:hypothetical protein